MEKHQNIIIQSRYQGYEIMFLLFRLKMKAESKQIFWICNQIIRKSGQGKRPDREVDPWNPPANDAAAAKSLQLCPTLHSPGPGILQARTQEWVAISFSMHESEKWKWSRSVGSDSSRPHGLQPTRLLHPWDFPGKSTGVGCHCLLRQMMLPGCNLRRVMKSL